MFYVYANGKTIYQPIDNTLSLFSPKLTIEMGKAGSLTFQIPPNHRYYNTLSQLTTTITVEMDDTEIFRGRVLTNNRNFNNMRTIYCEGDLAYLVDSVQKAEKYDGKVHALFRKIIAAHNARVEASKRFTVGNITVEDRDVLLTGESDDIQNEETGRFDYKQIAINSIADEWQNTFEFIETCLIDYTGGYLRTRRQNGVTYVDFLADYGTTATQNIEFGKNLLDLTEEVSAEDVFTVLIPLGDENLTIESVNNGSDELVDSAAVARYGRIVKTHVFDNVTEPTTLLENGRRFLASNVNMPVTITVKAIDMHLVDPNASPIFVGDKVHVTSVPHDMLDTLTCTKIEYDLENPANNTYTFGTPKQSLTERYRKDKAKQDAEQTRGGGGGGAGGGGVGEAVSEEAKKQLDEFFDAWINVNPEAAHIDLGALYKKFNDAKEVLESSCGVSLDAPAGNVNIKTLRKEFDDMGQVQKEQAAYIDLLNNELGARISLVASQHQELADLEAAHYAEMTVSANEQESAIKAKADRVTVDGMLIDLSALKDTVTDTNEILKKQVGIVLDGSQGNVNIQALNKRVDELGNATATNTASIETLANDTGSKITLLTESVDDLDTKTASVELRTSTLESEIELKADTVTITSEVNGVKSSIASVNSKITTINSEITTINSEITNVKKLIASEVEAVKSDITWMTAKQLTVTSVTADNFYSNNYVSSPRISMGGYLVATQHWVEEQLDGYLTSLPDYIKVKTLSATTNMYYQGWTVATQKWVKEYLSSFKISWDNISGKPDYFPAKSHRHSFSFSKTLPNGHSHKVTINGTSYTSTGVSANATHSLSISGNTGYTGG